MRTRIFMAAVTAGTILVIALDAPAAMAQIVQSDLESEPGTSETTQLVTSSTEVRRAVVGLIVVACVTAILTLLYWYKTGQQAKERHAKQFGGRHRADTQGPVVVDANGPWANEAAQVGEAHMPPAAPAPEYTPQRVPSFNPQAAAPARPVAPTPHQGVPQPVAAPPQEPQRPWGSGKPTWPSPNDPAPQQPTHHQS